jgi:hypothetical protein
MNDRDFLIWIHQRLVKVHKESIHVDYMHRLREVIHSTNPEKKTLPGASLRVLDEIEIREKERTKP